MKTIGFAISGKENEKRRALLPHDIEKIKNPDMLYFESDYGEILGFSNESYQRVGAKICSKDEIYNHPILCNPKAPQPSERASYKNCQTFFGWIHAVQSKETVDFLLSKDMSCIAWEDMFERGRHTFWRNNEIAGEAAALNAIQYLGKLPSQCKVALIGRGNCAHGAYKIFSQLGSEIIIYDRRTVQNLSKEIWQYDIVINAVLWDVFRNDHLISRSDLVNMKHGSMIIDISCDDGMGVETSHATTIQDPVYLLDGIIHYSVDHTPALFYKSASESISAALYPFIDFIVEERLNPVLESAMCIKNGKILDDRIIRFQNR